MSLNAINTRYPNLIFCIIAYTFIGIFMGSVGFFSMLWILEKGVPLFIATTLTALSMLSTVFMGNWISHYADTHAGGRKKAILFLLVVPMITIFLWSFISNVYVLYICFILVSAAAIVLLPFLDGIALQSLPIRDGQRINFVALRVCVTLGYVIGVVGVGYLIDIYSLYILPFFGGVFLLLIILAMPLLDTSFIPHEKSKKGNMSLDVLTLPWLKIFLIINIFYGIGTALYYGIASVYLEDLGFNKKQMGIIMFAGSVTEFIFFIYGKRMVERYRPLAIMAFCGCVASVRWYAISEYTGIVEIALITSLHGITFALYHAAGAYFIQRNVPSVMSSSAQSLFQASLIFIPMTVTLPLAGYLYPMLAENLFKIGSGLAMISIVLCVWALQYKGENSPINQ